jgi:hypothetical protein
VASLLRSVVGVAVADTKPVVCFGNHETLRVVLTYARSFVCVYTFSAVACGCTLSPSFLGTSCSDLQTPCESDSHALLFRSEMVLLLPMFICHINVVGKVMCSSVGPSKLACPQVVTSCVLHEGGIQVWLNTQVLFRVYYQKTPTLMHARR